jgi:GTP cyclohydrolase I
MLPDIQQTKPRIKSSIKRVGVSKVELPFRVMFRNGREAPAQVLATAEMVCSLNDMTRGISMSRFTRTIQTYLNIPLKRTTLELIVKDFKKQLETENVFLKVDFKLPIIKKSPISDNHFPQFYKCSFMSDYSDNKFKFYESVRVQYAAYCPCSAALCQEGKFGYPHNQRAFADVLVQTDLRSYVWLEDIIDLIENAVHTIPYPIIKRGDEKFIAGLAKNYPQFVEDSIREISHRLDFQRKIVDWHVRCTHEESIHTSNAIAINWKGLENGFNETTYI